jgi:cardiolipin synthase
VLFDLWSRALQILALIFHGLGLLNAVHAVLKVRAPQAAIGWAVALVAFPYAAVPLYWVFGRQMFIGYRKARGRGDSPLDRLAVAAAAALRPFSDAAAAPRFAALPEARGNTVELLIDGAETFPAIFAAIDAARDYIVVQFFIVRDDRLGRELRDHLLARLRAGVRVYFLYDEVGSHALPRGYVAALREAGARAAPFRTTRGRGLRLQLNFRNHRKLVVADGVVALTGGLNVGVEYCGESPRFGPWRDTHARVRGPAVQALQLSFVEDWQWATGEIAKLNWTPAAASGNQRVSVLATGPADALDICSLAFLDAVNSAHHRLWIASPYFVPDPAVLAALQLAAIRGVEVRIMLPDLADHLLPWLSSFSYYDALAQSGIALYRYRPGFLHQKVLLVDDALASVGSVNVDYRSFHLNFELAVLVRDHAFTAQVAAMLSADFARCRRVDLGEVHGRPAWFRAAVRVARLLSPVQ